ncbi:hypothetical protein [Polycladidibacter hongkongensis]|uniref:hypothetical protein n=1 Tax=Polycladidibacter hongkongensis TaxID=1647556 RepID=UPI00082C039F|nr:hypothetical protein [Pseudovibrio hongkongensis]
MLLKNLAKCEVALGGDREETVPQSGVSPAEFLILQEIHGAGSVFNLEFTPAAEDLPVNLERERLLEKYPARTDKPSPVAIVFPDKFAQLPSSFKECEILDEQLKPLSRVKVPQASAGQEPTNTKSAERKTKQTASRSKRTAAGEKKAAEDTDKAASTATKAGEGANVLS